jgi:hypothetical protein
MGAFSIGVSPMPFSNGVFSRVYNWVNDKNASIDITASRFDTEDDGFATGLSTCVLKDGSQTITANIPMAAFKFTGLGAGSARTDSANLGQVQDAGFNWVVAGGTADALTAGYSPALTALVDGQLCFVRASAANATTTPTFSPNSLTARTITKSGGTALAAGDIPGDLAEIILRYNAANTRWELLNPAVIAGTSTITMSGAAINEAQGADIASATTTDIGAATGNYVKVTGTTTITGLGTIQAGTERTVEFSGALTLTHDATALILLGGKTRQTAAGDVGRYLSEGSGNWREVSYVRAVAIPGLQIVAAVSFAGSSGAIEGNAFNVSSVTRNATGDYTVNFTNALPNLFYIPQVHSFSSGQIGETGLTTKTTSAYRFQTFSPATGNSVDPIEVYVIVVAIP